MRKQPYWWGHVRGIIQEYPSQRGLDLYGVALRNRLAVEEAISATECMTDGQSRLKLIRLLHWDRTRTVDGAAMDVHCGRTKAYEWQRDFFEIVARIRDMID